jgi:hypothetical protein
VFEKGNIGNYCYWCWLMVCEQLLLFDQKRLFLNKREIFYFNCTLEYPQSFYKRLWEKQCSNFKCLHEKQLICAAKSNSIVWNTKFKLPRNSSPIVVFVEECALNTHTQSMMRLNTNANIVLSPSGHHLYAIDLKGRSVQNINTSNFY